MNRGDDDVGRRMRLAILEEERTVTVKHVDDLKTAIRGVNNGVNLIRWGVGLTLALLISTYGMTAFFMWRLVEAVASR